MQRNAEKCCEMQINATFSLCGYFCQRVNIWKVSLDVSDVLVVCLLWVVAMFYPLAIIGGDALARS